MTADNSARNEPIFSDERIRNALRRRIDLAVNIRSEMTCADLARDSGVNIHTIYAILSHDVAKRRRIATEDAFSIAYTLGDDAVQALFGVMHYSGRRLDQADALQPMMVAATAMQHLSTIATAAADGRFDHTEIPACREAADMLIATVLPLSSAGAAA